MTINTARRAMSQIEVSMLFVHRANIEKYKKLLVTPLGADERVLIERRLAEEKGALLNLERKIS